MSVLKHIITIILTLFVTLVVKGQEEDETLVRISGNVTSDREFLEGVYVRNMTLKTFVITTKKGNFSLVVRQGDTLRATYLGMKDLVHRVTQNEVDNKFIQLYMVENTETLEEVTVQEQKITAVSLGIIDHEIKPMTKSERAYAAGSKFKWFYPLLIPVGGMPFDPILNAISGRTRKIKQRLEIDKEKVVIDELYEKFYVFSTLELKVPEDDVLLFMNYLEAHGKANELLKAEGATSEFLLTAAYQEYKAYLEED